jgi:hypothetical protein
LNIKEFRAETDAALRAAGLSEMRLPRRPLALKAWHLPADDLVRFFHPHAYRRPWGFVFSGYIGVEIPELRQWLHDTKTSEDVGVFHTHFVGYNILNEDGLSNFMVENDASVPASEWAWKIRSRLESIPATTAELVKLYRSNRERLGWLAAPNTKPKWDFYFAWKGNPAADLQVPRMSPTGHIG